MFRHIALSFPLLPRDDHADGSSVFADMRATRTDQARRRSQSWEDRTRPQEMREQVTCSCPPTTRTGVTTSEYALHDGQAMSCTRRSGSSTAHLARAPASSLARSASISGAHGAAATRSSSGSIHRTSSVSAAGTRMPTGSASTRYASPVSASILRPGADHHRPDGRGASTPICSPAWIHHEASAAASSSAAARCCGYSEDEPGDHRQRMRPPRAHHPRSSARRRVPASCARRLGVSPSIGRIRLRRMPDLVRSLGTSHPGSQEDAPQVMRTRMSTRGSAWLLLKAESAGHVGPMDRAYGFIVHRGTTSPLVPGRPPLSTHLWVRSLPCQTSR